MKLFTKTTITAALAAMTLAPVLVTINPAIANAATVEQSATSAMSSDVQFYVKDTAVKIRNDGDRDMYVRQYKNLVWFDPDTVRPGTEKAYWSWDVSVVDDVELNVFYDWDKAVKNEGGTNVDADNPSCSTPYLSVDWNRKYLNEGSTHSWVSSKDGSLFWGKRENDSKRFKEFRLHVTNK